jgi:hypothetical protein
LAGAASHPRAPDSLVGLFSSVARHARALRRPPEHPVTSFVVNCMWFVPAFLIAAVVLGEAIRLRVRSHHPQLWEELGKPAPLSLERINGLLTRRTDRGLGDPTLTKLATSMIWLRRAFLIFAVVWLFALTSGEPLPAAILVAILAFAALIDRYTRRRGKAA